MGVSLGVDIRGMGMGKEAVKEFEKEVDLGLSLLYFRRGYSSVSSIKIGFVGMPTIAPRFMTKGKIKLKIVGNHLFGNGVVGKRIGIDGGGHTIYF